MSQVSSSLTELVELLNDGISFYQDAAAKVSDPSLSQLMLKMSHLKQAIAADLNAEIALEGEAPREHGSWFGGMRRTYADLLARFGELDGEHELIARLEEHEDQLLAAFREATQADSSPRVRDLAQNYFPEIEAMHARMRDLKQGGSATGRNA
jgi:uncharacterized protein (TIGR02284 family)